MMPKNDRLKVSVNYDSCVYPLNKRRHTQTGDPAPALLVYDGMTRWWCTVPPLQDDDSGETQNIHNSKKGHTCALFSCACAHTLPHLPAAGTAASAAMSTRGEGYTRVCARATVCIGGDPDGGEGFLSGVLASPSNSHSLKPMCVCVCEWPLKVVL